MTKRNRIATLLRRLSFGEPKAPMKIERPLPPEETSHDAALERMLGRWRGWQRPKI